MVPAFLSNPQIGATSSGQHEGCSRQMTSDNDPVNLRVLQSANPETREPGDKVNAISLMLALIGSIALLAITIGIIWK
jgi:hypothetical protein